MSKLTSIKRSSIIRRRVRNSLITLGAIAILGVIVYALNQSLRQSSFTTGYLLLGAIIFLTSFNLRKKLTFLPEIGSAAFWMQLHIYVGLSTFAMFGFHIGWKIPNGQFETLLAALYLVVAFSGVYGLYVTRVLPSRISALTEEVIFERIPMFRQQIAARARGLVLESCESTDILAKYYANRLSYFLERPPSMAYIVRPSGRKRRRLVNEIEDLDRYLAADQRQVSQQLSKMVREKDDLDFHYAMQGRLKVWLFVHIGLTYSLLAVGLLHAVLAHAFSGGLS